MSLLPAEAVSMLYRRYLKAANKIPNNTIRMLLIQQVRHGFRAHRGIISPAAQRDLVEQSHKDLSIIEDDRLARTLYINNLGQVSCLDWEVRRTEMHIEPQSSKVLFAFLVAGLIFVCHIPLTMEPVSEAFPEISDAVDKMAYRLEAESLEALYEKREKQMQQTIDQQQFTRDFEQRVLTTFRGAPKNARVPSPLFPTGQFTLDENAGKLFK